MSYYVYILTNKSDRVMYIGVTNDLVRRLYEHKQELVEGFTKRYHVHKLVYYEQTTDVRSAIEREKELKGWRRARKNALVESMNPESRICRRTGNKRTLRRGAGSFAALRMTGGEENPGIVILSAAKDLFYPLFEKN